MKILSLDLAYIDKSIGIVFPKVGIIRKNVLFNKLDEKIDSQEFNRKHLWFLAFDNTQN